MEMLDVNKEENTPIDEHKFEMDGLVIEFKEKGSEFELEWSVGTERGKFDKDALFALAFLISNPAQQEALVPIKTTEKRVFRQVKRVKLTRDMKAGQELVVPFKFTVDAEMLVAASQNGLYIPKKVE